MRRSWGFLVLILVLVSVKAAVSQAPQPPPNYLQEEKAWIKEDGAPRDTWDQYNDTSARILNLTYRYSAVNIAYVIRSSDPSDVIRATFIAYRNESPTNGFNSTGHLYPHSVPVWSQLLSVSTNQTQGQFTYHLFIATFDPGEEPGVYEVRINLTGTLSGGSSWKEPDGNPRVPWMFFRVPRGTSWPVCVSDQLGRNSPFFFDTPIPSTEFNASMIIMPPGNKTGTWSAAVQWNSTNWSTLISARVPIYYLGQGRWAAKDIVAVNSSTFPANYTTPYTVNVKIGPYERQASFYVYPGSAAIPPDTWLVKTPPPVSGNRSATFEWTGSDIDGQVVQYEYHMDSGEWTTTEKSNVAFHGLSNGTHRFEVRSRDEDGIDDPTPAWFSFVVKVNVPPDTWILSGPSATSLQRDVSFSWGGSDQDGTVQIYQYRMDGGSWLNTTETEISYLNLSSGNHTFQVRSVDNQGAADPSPANWTFKILPTWCEREVDVLRTLVDDLEQRIQMLALENSNLTLRISQLHESNLNLSDRIRTLEQEKAQLESQIHELESDRAELLERVENLTAEKNDLLTQLETCEKASSLANDEKQVLEHQILDLDQTVSLCQAEAERLQDAKSNLLRLVEDLRNTISDLKSELPEPPVYPAIFVALLCLSGLRAGGGAGSWRRPFTSERPRAASRREVASLGRSCKATNPMEGRSSSATGTIVGRRPKDMSIRRSNRLRP